MPWLGRLFGRLRHFLVRSLARRGGGVAVEAAGQRREVKSEGTMVWPRGVSAHVRA